MNATTDRKLPTHRAYFVKDARSDGEKPEWIELGTAWPHSDGKGLDVVLKVLPVGGFAGRPRFAPSSRTAASRTPPDNTLAPLPYLGDAASAAAIAWVISR